MSLVLQSLLPFPHSCQGSSPHQQGRDARMIEQCFGGIDVSQDRLDVLLLPRGTGFSVANDEAGWSTLIGRLRDCSSPPLGSSRAAATSAASSAPCSPPACRCVTSIPTDFGSSPAPAAPSPRTIGSMPG